MGVSTLPSCLWSLRIFPSLLPGSHLTNFDRDVSSALLQLVNRKLNFTYSRTNAFRYGRQNKNPALARIALTTSALLAGVQATVTTFRSSAAAKTWRAQNQQGTNAPAAAADGTRAQHEETTRRVVAGENEDGCRIQNYFVHIVGVFCCCIVLQPRPPK